MATQSNKYRLEAEITEFLRTQSAAEFPPSERLTLWDIFHHLNKDTLACWVSNRRLAEIGGQGESTVRKNVAAIVERGILEKTPGRAGRGMANTNRYRGRLGFSGKTVSAEPFTENGKRSESAPKTVWPRPRTAGNQETPSTSAPLTGASPRQSELAERIEALATPALEAFVEARICDSWTLRYETLPDDRLRAIEAAVAGLEQNQQEIAS